MNGVAIEQRLKLRDQLMKFNTLTAAARFTALALLASSALPNALNAEQSNAAINQAESESGENVIVVMAELEPTNVLQLSSSVTVVDAETMKRNNAQHFSDLLNLAPNVNFASGASRGRFVQIRGIGERSEFSEPVNYSVGVVVDGVDLTGIATGATLLDIQQMEVLRGPQGTLYGANGLAGLINIVSNSPSQDFYSSLNLGVENYGGKQMSAVVSDSLSENLSYRFAVGQYQSDGYMENVFLNRDDTQNIDESSLRAKLVYQPSESFKLTTNLFFIEADNGYDAFSLDSNRTTYSDEPGTDAQQTRAASIIADWDLTDDYRLETIISGANSDLIYSYDEDWSNTGICDGTLCDSADWGFDWWYSSFDQFVRENKNNSVDLRLHSKTSDQAVSWSLGYYLRDQQVDMSRQYTFAVADFFSRFDTKNSAIYGQVKTPLSDTYTLVTGLRYENRKAEYIDSNTATFSPDESMWGGKIALENQYADNRMVYALISRGFKAGGFNTRAVIPEQDRTFDAEFMWNYEAGIKGRWWDNSLTLQSSVFYQDRSAIQSKQSLILSNDTGNVFSPNDPCPCSFNDYIINAPGGGISYGLEIEAKWRAADNIELYSSLGLLKTEYQDFESYTHMLADQESNPPVPYDLDGRSLAHSPEYQMVLGSNFYVTDEWMLNAQIEAKDSFYFSDRHELQSDSYATLNWGISYLQNDWQLNFYIRNVTDETIQTRGFGSFPNDPRDLYETFGPYYQFGAPRTYALTASVLFD
jgi:iron complex outermembrane recepter protein